MSYEFNVCNKCGSQVPAQAKFCTKCGNPMTSASNAPQQTVQNFTTQPQPMPDYNTSQPVQNQQFNAPAVPDIAENGKKKKSKRAVLGSVFGVIGAIIIGVIIRVATTELASEVVDDVFLKLDINNYVETINSYEAGAVEDNAYTSEYFGFEITPDENWVVNYDQIGDITGEELQSMKDEKRSNLELIDISESQIETVLNNFYYSLEYYADYYNEDNEITCSANIQVLSDAGVDNSGLDEIIKLNKSDYNSQGIFPTTSKTELAGNEVAMFEYSIENQGDYTNPYTYVKQYIGFEGDLTYCITVIYTYGYEDIADSFIDSISEY